MDELRSRRCLSVFDTANILLSNHYNGACIKCQCVFKNFYVGAEKPVYSTSCWNLSCVQAANCFLLMRGRTIIGRTRRVETLRVLFVHAFICATTWGVRRGFAATICSDVSPAPNLSSQRFNGDTCASNDGFRHHYLWMRLNECSVHVCLLFPL